MVRFPLPPAPAVGLLLIRLAFGYHLIQYSYGEVLGGELSTSFGPYLAKLGVPWPTFMGYLAMGTELIGGLCLVLGLLTRWVAVPLLINFTVALLLVHLHQPYAKGFECIQMLAVAGCLLTTGAGRLSLDALFHLDPYAADAPLPR